MLQDDLILLMTKINLQLVKNLAVFPPPPSIPLATSSPATSIVRSRPLRENPIPVAREKSISHSSTSSNEENLLSSGSKSNSAAANLVDPYTLISKTSASEFRKNNDSISSNTTNEDIDEDEDFNYCDSNEQQVPANGDVINTEDSDEALEEKEFVETNLAQEYAVDILKSMIKREDNFQPKWNYMTKQPDITFTMRSILVDWLVEVAEEYKLQTETLYLAVAYIDRFLSYMSVQRSKLQLVGTACMFIAAKYEEIYPPDVGEFVYITDDTYNKRQVLRMEHLVLKVLGFDLSGPSANVFLSQMSELSKTKEKTKHLAMFLSELSLLHGDRFLKFSPSLMAAASLALARHSLGSSEAEVWTSELASFTGYQVEDFRECLLALHSMWGEAAASPQQAINEKYKSSKYHSVSELSPAPLQH